MPVVVSTLIALIAIAVAIGSWFRPLPDDHSQPTVSTPQYTESEITESITAVCAAQDLVSRGTERAANQTSDDPNIRTMLSLNVRIGATVSADYLRAVVTQHPATPPELADAAVNLALAFNNTTLLQIADATDEELQMVYKDLDNVGAELVSHCG